MATLEDLLASSSSEGEIASPARPAPKLARRSPTAARKQLSDERLRQQEELKSRMFAALGENAAIEAIPKPHGLPPTAPPYGGDTPPKRLDPSALRVESARDSEELCVMVVNRGCQTSTDAECQTDPDPHLLECRMCYRRYYGHNASGCDCHESRKIPTPSHRRFSKQEIRDHLVALTRTINSMVTKYDLADV